MRPRRPEKLQMGKTKNQPLVLVEQIEPRILLIRGQRVILDADLAELYGTSTKRLNKQVKRNLDRFPADFMYHLTSEEAQSMRSQSVTTSDPLHRMQSQIATASSRHTATLTKGILNPIIVV